MKSILVVDDETAIAEVVESLLTLERYEVHCAHDGREALDRLASTAPDLILSDIMMPYVDGIELTRRVRKCWPQTAIVLMSAAARPPQDLDGMYVAFVAKPFDLDTLLRAVVTAIGTSE